MTCRTFYPTRKEFQFYEGAHVLQLSRASLISIIVHMQRQFKPREVANGYSPKSYKTFVFQKYLSDTEFVDVFKMPREEFDKMAPWKQANLKKNVSLY